MVITENCFNRSEHVVSDFFPFLKEIECLVLCHDVSDLSEDQVAQKRGVVIAEIRIDVPQFLDPCVGVIRNSQTITDEKLESYQ